MRAYFLPVAKLWRQISHPFREGKPSSLDIPCFCSQLITAIRSHFGPFLYPLICPLVVLLTTVACAHCYTLNTHPTYLFLVAERSVVSSNRNTHYSHQK